MKEIGSKIKIIFLTTGLGTGGAEMMLYKLLRHINRRRFDVLVISLVNGGGVRKYIEGLGVRVIELGMKRGVPDPHFVVKLVNILKKEKPDILQTWMYHANLIGLIAGKLAKVPKIIWGIRHSNLDKQENKKTTLITVKVCSVLSKFVDKIVCCSKASFQVHNEVGYKREKMVVIPNGFSIEAFFADKLARNKIRNELKVSSDTPIVGLIGRWDPLKDHLNFIKASNFLVEKHSDVQFLLCGKDITKNNEELYRWIKESGLESHFHLLGMRKDIPNIMSALDVLALSSSGEAFPNVVGEAMACEVPCVVTDVGDAAYIVGNTGKVVPKKNPLALANALSDILSLPMEERLLLGKKARERVKSNFEINKVVGQYENLYLSIV